MTEPVFDLELSPMARQAGVAYLHDVHLDAGEELAVGARVRRRDEAARCGTGGGAVVEVRLGPEYRLSIRPGAGSGAGE